MKVQLIFYTRSKGVEFTRIHTEIGCAERRVDFKWTKGVIAFVKLALGSYFTPDYYIEDKVLYDARVNHHTWFLRTFGSAPVLKKELSCYRLGNVEIVPIIDERLVTRNDIPSLWKAVFHEPFPIGSGECDTFGTIGLTKPYGGALPFPFNSPPALRNLVSIIDRGALSALWSLEIFSEKEVATQMQRLHSDPSVSRFLPAGIRLSSPAELENAKNRRFGALVPWHGPPIKVQIAVPQIGAALIFSYLKFFCQIPITLDFSHAHGVDVAKGVNCRDNPANVLCFGFIPMTEALRKGAAFVPAMHMPCVPYYLLSSGKTLQTNLPFVGLNRERSSPMSCFEQVVKSTHRLENAEPDEVFRLLLEGEKLNAITFFPYGPLTAKAFRLHSVSDHICLKTRPAVMFLRQEFIDQGLDKQLSALVRHAWLKLRQEDETRRAAIEHLIQGTNFLNRACTYGGFFRVSPERHQIIQKRMDKVA